MSDELNGLIQTVTSLCADPKWEAILNEIVAVDKAHENNQFGWEYRDIPSWSGSHVNILLQKGIVKYGYKSSQYTHYRLAVDREELASILNGIKNIREEANRQKETQGKPTLDPELTKEFEQLITTEKDLLGYWAQRLNPKIEGLELIKKALLLSIASDEDKFGDRGRLHVLLYGEPGSAKSQLISWIVYQLGAHFCSQRTSKVGLTADATGNELTPGALPRANKDILCIDELDKYNNADRQGMLEAMEEGKVHIEVGKISATLDAEVRILAAANRIQDFSEELLDRFDFKFEMLAPVGEMQKKVTCSIVKNWFKEKPGYYGVELKSYLAWIKGYEPDISPEVRDKIEQLLCMYLDLDEGLKGSPRRTESVMRIAYTVAKIHKRNVEVGDIITAIKLSNPNLNNGKLQALGTLATMKP